MATKQSPYGKITEQMLKMLDEGTAPWRKTWSGSSLRPISLSTKKPYRGVNQLMLWFTAEERGYGSPYWGTYRQIGEMGGQVRKGEKSTTVVLWGDAVSKTEVDADGNPKKFVFMKGFNVFNAEQADWEEGKRPEVPEAAARTEVETIAEAEAIVQRYLADNGPSLSFGGDRAYYRPASDAVQMPERDDFEGAGEYYLTLFHELGHSTGHKSRLDREGITDMVAFGDPVYSREELVAEFTAAFLAGQVGTLGATVENSAAYIAGWRKALTDDPKAVVWAAGRAQKAADLILGVAA